MKMLVHATHTQGADLQQHAQLQRAVQTEQHIARHAEAQAKIQTTVTPAPSASAGQNLNAKA
ncbi:MAG: hypothetical protein SFV32_06425 [Opitutaceae bacterium]|nr:hypothetical protein [Opitutaceae bacterium]